MMKITLFLCCIILNLSCLTTGWAESASSVETALENYRQQNTAYDAALQTFYAARTTVAEKQNTLAVAQKEVEISQADFATQEEILNDVQKLERRTGIEISAAIKKKYFDAKAQLDAALANVSKLEKAVQEAVQQQNTSQGVVVQAWEKLDRMRTALAETRFQVLQQQIEQQREVSVAFEHPCGDEMSRKQCREQAMERAKRDAIEKGAAILVDAVSEAKLVKDASGVPQLKLTKDDIRTESSGLVLSLQSVRNEFTPNGNFLLEIKAVVKGQAGETLKERVFNQTAAIPALPEVVKAGLTVVPQSTSSFSSTNPQPGKSFRDKLKDGSMGPEMVEIPAGTFQMGSNESDDEKPVHTVNVKAFYMSKYETTIAEYLACVQDGGCKPPQWLESGSEYNIHTGSDYYYNDSYKRAGMSENNKNHPIIGVSWNDAKAYGVWLSKKTGKEYRLPTEAQWEYACRAGSTGKYSFGNDKSQLGNYGWYDDNSGETTHPVGGKKPNAWGLYDMHGNVWEWLEDVYHDSYSGAPVDGSMWVSGGDSNIHLVRGGSWFSNDNFLRCADRGRHVTSSWNYGWGFRISRM